jgi:hypothetical protein
MSARPEAHSLGGIFQRLVSCRHGSSFLVKRYSMVRSDIPISTGLPLIVPGAASW